VCPECRSLAVIFTLDLVSLSCFIAVVSLRLGHLALVNLQGLMATQLQGCSWDGTTTSNSSWFGTAFLMILDFALGWVLMVHDASKHGLQVQSTTIVA